MDQSKTLKSSNRKLCDKTKNLTHLYTESKRNKKIWKYLQKILSNSHTKTKYTITTYPNNIILVTTTKKKTYPDTNNHNTNPHMESKEETTI